MSKKKLTANQTNLTRRYLIWCYKTTKESLDRIDRYFTQLDVDAFILKEISKKKTDQGYKALIDDFQKYMKNKKDNVLKQKYTDAKFSIETAQYQYLQNRFQAIEKAIVKFLGKSELKKISDLYEQEMTTRILQAREH